ncbi:MAG: translation elongation factor Ts [Candidatus Gracilibacteria bacterium]|jgi:elongation factor Ts
MTEISASQVKELRDATGISMMKCKEALVEAKGDLEKAREVLRKQGEKDAAKKSTRSAAEGSVAVKISKDGKKGIAVQLLCETDFVARNEDFVKLAEAIAEIALTEGIPAAQAKAPEMIQAKITKLGENIQLGEFKELAAESAVADYKHSNNKIGVLVSLKKGKVEVGKDIAMQIAAMNPAYLSPEEVSDEEFAKELDIQKALLAKEGKPAEMAEKILAGKMKKFREEQSLIKQAFVKDSSKTVEAYLKEMDVEITQFIRLSI